MREARDVAEATLDIRTNGLPSLILLDVSWPVVPDDVSFLGVFALKS